MTVRCYSVTATFWSYSKSIISQIQWLHKSRPCLVPPSPVITLHLTEGLWECEKTILGHRGDYCTSFVCSDAGPLPGIEEKSGSRRLVPHRKSTAQVQPCFFTILGSWILPLGSSLTAVILNISLFWQHYHFQLITIFPIFFSPFVLNR